MWNWSGFEGLAWSFWWFCPLMMVVMMLMCGIMGCGRRPGPHP